MVDQRGREYELIDKNLPGYRGKTWLCKYDGVLFIVSESKVSDKATWPETYSFYAWPDGSVMSWKKIMGSYNAEWEDIISRTLDALEGGK